ncbi:serine protease (plasmid) [Kovacikia minuta CCNUW1]|uniref:S1 family peptidase n=1 Tax=Kovacikia minuta TaxID=2931930 RepID=UPI001CCDC28D|nr:serine protease [Kovacikia minuta]UBF29909.1 serine protease [Kovacikia minuta CCNUW1]
MSDILIKESNPYLMAVPRFRLACLFLVLVAVQWRYVRSVTATSSAQLSDSAGVTRTDPQQKEQEPERESSPSETLPVDPDSVRVSAGRGMGSGSIVSSDGLVLTNSHVVEGSRTVQVQLYQNRRPFKTVSGVVLRKTDRFREAPDFALVKLRMEGTFPYLKRCSGISELSKIQIVGFPIGTFDPVIKKGVVASLAGSPKSNQLMVRVRVQPGNSGGPMLDSEGRLCGVVTAQLGGGGNPNQGSNIAGVQSIQSINQFLAKDN